MKRLLPLLLLLLFIPLISFGQSKKIKKVAKKLDVFLIVQDIGKVSVIDYTNSGLEANLTRYLMQSGYETFSKRVAERQLAQIKLNKNTIDIYGSAIKLKSDIVIIVSGVRILGVDEVVNAAFEIIELEDGRVIGGASYNATIGGRSVHVIAEAFVYGLNQFLNK